MRAADFLKGETFRDISCAGGTGDGYERLRLSIPLSLRGTGVKGSLGFVILSEAKNPFIMETKPSFT